MDGLRPKGHVGTADHPGRTHRTEHSGEKEFGPLTPAIGKSEEEEVVFTMSLKIN